MMRKISILECFDIVTGKRTELGRFDGCIEAPNWLPDGRGILYNAEGRIWRYQPETRETAAVETGVCTSCNNDHVPSPDGRRLGISDSPTENGGLVSRIYVLPLEGGAPRLVTENSPSFLHGWSHDGAELAYCAFRGSSVDIYTISPAGGAERRLTDGAGYHDGPEYSPDDEHIWFNSTRNGLMQIYRMDRDGKNLTQMTDDDSNNWFPHISPDGKKVVYLSFRKGDLEPWQHLPDKQVALWLMDADGGRKEKLCEIFGGQGTINVNSWAPDGRRFAFVRYLYA